MKSLNRSQITTQSLPIKILQFGNGNFIRGFLDWMVQKTIDQGYFKGGIHSVQIHSSAVDQRMLEQNCLFHVAEMGIYEQEKTQQYSLISCVQNYSSIFESYDAFLQLAENPDLEFIFSNTTEAGIEFDPNDSDFTSIPKTFPGKLTALLHKRFQVFEKRHKPLGIIPLELLENNGDLLKSCVLKYAELWGLSDAFIQWLDSNCIFCNTLVDRIVPGYPKNKAIEIQQEIGFEDQLLVQAEPYYFLAIERGEKIKNQLGWEKAGLNVKFVKDISPYRLRKVRILNGAHTAMVPFAYLLGCRTVRESINDERIGQWIRELIFQEIVPSMDLEESELKTYAKAILERFENPFLDHQLESIALNSISKFRIRVLTSILEYHNKFQKWPEQLLFAFAALILIYKGKNQGKALPLKDNPEILEFFLRSWNLENRSVSIKGILQNQNLWGQDLYILPGLAKTLLKALKKLESELNSSEG